MTNIVIINGQVVSGGMNMVQGNGNIQTEDVKTISPESDIQTVLAEGAVSLILDVRPEHEGKSFMSIKAEENILPLIDIRHVNGTVAIGSKGNYNSAVSPVITLHCAGLQKLDLSGATTALGEILQHKLKIDVSGSSKVLLKGQVQRLEIDSSGASDVALGELFAQKAFIDVSGASKVSVWVEKEAAIEASGACKINVYGDNVKIAKSTSGVAKVSEYPKAALNVFQTVSNISQSINEPETTTDETNSTHKSETAPEPEKDNKTINFKKFI